MSNQLPRSVIMYFLYLPILKLGKQNRMYIKIIKKFLENDYIISN